MLVWETGISGPNVRAAPGLEQLTMRSKVGCVKYNTRPAYKMKINYITSLVHLEHVTQII